MYAELEAKLACLQFLPSATSLVLENVLKIASNDMALLHFSFIEIVISLPWRDVVGFEIGRRILPVSDDYIHASFLWIQQEKCHFSTIFLAVAQDIFLKLLTLRFSRTFKRFYSSNLFRMKNLGGIYSTWIGPQLRNGKGVPQRTQNRNDACSFHLLQQIWLRKPS